jgi:hypothetical protein
MVLSGKDQPRSRGWATAAATPQQIGLGGGAPFVLDGEVYRGRRPDHRPGSVAAVPCRMSSLRDLVAAELSTPTPAPITAFAEHLTTIFPGAQAVLFYGSILRTGDLTGVLDYYVLTDRPPLGWRGVFTRILWPDVSYHELTHEGQVLRAKVASMTLSQFRARRRRRGFRHHHLGPLRSALRADLGGRWRA